MTSPCLHLRYNCFNWLCEDKLSSYQHCPKKPICQDDVENYFSLVRGREVSPTDQRYMEIQQTLDIDFCITQELGLLDGSSSSYEGPAVTFLHSPFT